jgi:short-subunit dehydrogenase
MVNTSKNNLALVTGASYGIGAEFVEILAGRGCLKSD